MDERSRTLIRQAWPRQLVFTLLLAALLFVPAGSLSFWQGWLFLIVFIGSSVALGLYFVRHDPALIERRMHAGPGAEQEPAQKRIMTLLMAGFLLLILVPGFDHRWHWSAVPDWLAVLADAGIVASFAVFFAVMKQNSYAAATVRVEADQPVISTGLYGVVRHPMYSGALAAHGLHAAGARLLLEPTSVDPGRSGPGLAAHSTKSACSGATFPAMPTIAARCALGSFHSSGSRVTAFPPPAPSWPAAIPCASCRRPWETAGRAPPTLPPWRRPPPAG